MATDGAARGTGAERAFVDPLPEAGEVTLDAEESVHLVRVRRAAAGTRVVLVDGRGRARHGRLLDADPRAARVEVGEAAPVREPARPLTLAVAPPEGARSDQLVEGLAWLGAACLRPLVSARLPAGRLESALRRRARHLRLAREALKGSGRGCLLELGDPLPLAEALAARGEGGAPVLLDPDPEAPTLLSLLCAAPDAGAASSAAPRGPALPLLLVGPEGGFTAEEVALARERGARVARLVAPALRVELAALAAAAQALGL